MRGILLQTGTTVGGWLSLEAHAVYIRVPNNLSSDKVSPKIRTMVISPIQIRKTKYFEIYFRKKMWIVTYELKKYIDAWKLQVCEPKITAQSA